MAAPTCTFCGQYQAVFMGTSMEDGETFCACGICLPGVMLGMTAALVTDMPADDAQSHAEAFNAILAVYVPPEPPKPSRKRSGAPAVKSTDQADPPSSAMPGDQPLLGECPNCGDMVEMTADGNTYCAKCSPLFMTPATAE